jgi:hypothetical protein
MTLTWHIFKKDFVRLRIPLSLWTALMAAKIAFYASISGVFGAPSAEWLSRMMNGPELALRSLVEPLVAFILVGWMVYEDPVVGGDAFWLTRPISGTRLLAAKALGACLLFVALPVLINVPWWLACGFGAHQVVTAALPMAAEYSLVVIVGMAAASATDAFPRFFLWTAAGIAALLAAHLIISLCLGNGLGFRAGQEMGGGQFLTRVLVFILCIAAVSAEVVLHQFLPRRARRLILGLIAATLVASAAICSSSLTLFRELGHGKPKPPAESAKEDSPGRDVSIEIPKGTGARPYIISPGPYYIGSMVVPIALHGLKDNEAAFLPTVAEWKINGNSVWKIGGAAFGSQYRMLQDRMQRMLGMASGPNDFTADVVFSFPRALAQRLIREAAVFDAKVRLDLMEGRIAAELPLEDQSFRYGDGSFSISGFSRTATAVSMVMTNRLEGLDFSQQLEVFWPHPVTLALASRVDKAVLTGSQENAGAWSFLQLNMVQVTSQMVRFEFPQDAKWIDRAKFVVFDFAGGTSLVRTLDMDPFLFTMRALETPKAKAPRKF